MDRVRALVEAEPAVASERNEQGTTAVLQARYHGRLDMVDVLRAARGGLDVHEAAALGDADRVRELVDSDPEPRERLRGGRFLSARPRRVLRPRRCRGAPPRARRRRDAAGPQPALGDGSALGGRDEPDGDRAAAARRRRPGERDAAGELHAAPRGGREGQHRSSSRCSSSAEPTRPRVSTTAARPPISPPRRATASSQNACRSAQRPTPVHEPRDGSAKAGGVSACALGAAQAAHGPEHEHGDQPAATPKASGTPSAWPASRLRFASSTRVIGLILATASIQPCSSDSGT